jgi:flagellar biosynthesis/type III secretory pathway protein FliH
MNKPTTSSQTAEPKKSSKRNALDAMQELYERWEREKIEQGLRLGLLRLLTCRFGALPETATARVSRAIWQQVWCWYGRVLDAASLDDVFAENAFEEDFREGVKQGEAKMLMRALEHRFGALSHAVTARVMGASIEDIERWLGRVLDAASLDDVFAG